LLVKARDRLGRSLELIESLGRFSRLTICRLRGGSIEEIEKPGYLAVFDGPDMGERSGDRLAGGLDLGG
jgi:hypothetical protein